MRDLEPSEYDSLFRLDGKHAVVVGAASGLGRAGAIGLATAGASVTCVDIDADGAEATARTLRELGADASSFVQDVTAPDAGRVIVDALPAANVLVFTPAVNRRKRMIDTTDEDFSFVMSVNLDAPYRIMRDVGRDMAGRGGGSIVVFSSIRAITVEPGQALYAASKGAVVGLVRTLAVELGEHGVRVNGIAPGPIETPLNVQVRSDKGWYESYRLRSPLGRWGRPHEMAGPTVFLASESSSLVTGSLLMVDAGWTVYDGFGHAP